MKIKKKIYFIKSGKAYLPEIEAYSKFFSVKGFDCNTISYNKFLTLKQEANIFWFFMGFYPKSTSNGIVIHDYRSLSTGTWCKIKDYIKCKLNPKPTLRIFLNKNVKNMFKFNDGIPSFLIGMGVDFPPVHTNNKSRDILYDYIYVGVVSNDRGIDCLLRKFVESKTSKKLLMVGVYDEILYSKYNNQNIIFVGKVSREQVYKYLMQSETGISYIPQGMPYDVQVSTKMLEYAWCGLKIVANDSQSNRLTAEKMGFECAMSNGTFFDLKINNNGNVNIQEHLLWEKILFKSGVFDFLENCIEAGE